eukprot:10249545-Alexandrium_andersonii.AAC.1
MRLLGMLLTHPTGMKAETGRAWSLRVHETRSKSRPAVPSPSALLHLGVPTAPRVAVCLALEAG